MQIDEAREAVEPHFVFLSLLAESRFAKIPWFAQPSPLSSGRPGKSAWAEHLRPGRAEETLVLQDRDRDYRIFGPCSRHPSDSPRQKSKPVSIKKSRDGLLKFVDVPYQQIRPVTRINDGQEPILTATSTPLSVNLRCRCNTDPP